MSEEASVGEGDFVLLTGYIHEFILHDCVLP